MSGLKKYLNVYEFDTKLPLGGQEIKYKGMSTNLIKKLLIFENDKNVFKEEEMLDFILKEVIITEGIKIDDLSVMDRYYLLIKVREATKGSIYKYKYDCPKCKSKSTQSLDIADIDVKNPTISDDDRILKLLNDNVVFVMKHPIRKLQKGIHNTISKKLSDTEKRIEIQLADIASYVSSVSTPDGKHELNYKELIDFIGDLPETELEVLRNWQEKYYYGIELKHNNVCAECGNEEERDIPITNFFS